MKVIVSGAAGFIGRRVTDELKGKGVTVIPVDKVTGYDLTNLSTLKELEDIVRTSNENFTIIHLAALVDARESLEKPSLFLGNNLGSTYNVAQLGRLENVKRIIFTSSAAVYGEPEYLPIDVSHPLRPLNPYGISKVYEEELLRRFSEEYGYELLILRLFNVYGEEQEKGLFGALRRAIREGKPFYLYGDGTQVRDFIYVGDVAKLLVEEVDSGRTGTYNVCSGVGVSVREIVEWVKEVYPDLEILRKSPIPGEIHTSIGKPDIKLEPLTKERLKKILEV